MQREANYFTLHSPSSQRTKPLFRSACKVTVHVTAALIKASRYRPAICATGCSKKKVGFNVPERVGCDRGRTEECGPD